MDKKVYTCHMRHALLNWGAHASPNFSISQNFYFLVIFIIYHNMKYRLYLNKSHTLFPYVIRFFLHSALLQNILEDIGYSLMVFCCCA